MCYAEEVTEVWTRDLTVLKLHIFVTLKQNYKNKSCAIKSMTCSTRNK